MEDQLIDTFELFLSRYYNDEVTTLVNDYPCSCSLHVNFSDLDKFNVELAQKLLKEPDIVLHAFNEALKNRAGKENLHVRITNNSYKVKIGDIRHDHIGKMVTFDGLVLKATEVRPKFTVAAFQCPFCAHITYLEQTTPKRLLEPRSCDACGRKVSKFILLPELSKYTDSQKIRLQESLEELRGGDVPATKDVELEGDLTGSIAPGDRLIVNGILRSEIKVVSGTKSPLFEVYIEANAIDVLEKVFDEVKISGNDEREIKALSEHPSLYGELISTIAPTIYGLEEIKEAILLQLFSGVPKAMDDGTALRGDIHILLVGDAGLAKSRLLSSAASMAPRGLFTSGSSSTAAGLTASAVKDEFSDGAWSLEAGALVLADRGLACIAEGQNVITPTGIMQIEDIKPGDKVMSHSGSGPIIQSVKHVIDQGIKQTMVLHLYDGSRIECTADHKILTAKGWKEAGDVKVGDFFVVPANYDTIKITDKVEFEKGFLHGFGLSDIHLDRNKTNNLTFSASLKNNDRTQYIIALLERHYNSIVTTNRRPAVELNIKGWKAKFGPSTINRSKSKEFKDSLISLFENNQLPSGSRNFKIGFIAGILSTDCCFTHGKESNSIIITLGRRRYSDKWLNKKMTLLNSMFHELGIMSVIRKRRIAITSLQSYNRVLNIFSPLLVGLKKDQLYPITPIIKKSSYDCYLDGKYVQWFSGIKFRTVVTRENGLHSRIWKAQKTGIVTTYLMDTLKPHWAEITKEPFKDYKKTYLLNRVQKIEKGSMKRVHDLAIDGEHNFIVEGCTVHNCVDELDKMSKHDRDSLHEALEQGRVSVAKAGIVASLHSRCSLLAAANPTSGRFDPYEPIAKQVNMAPTLLSRFDLIFMMLDQSDEEKDTKLAQHVLQTHKRGEAKQKSGEEAEDENTITPLLLRKYIAYSRKVIPQISDEAMTKFQNFYVDLRRKSKKEDAAIPITVRQLESLVRLGEASARTRLSDIVTEEDADRVLALFMYCMRSVYTDPESGHLDVDWVVAGTSKTKRDRSKSIRQIMVALEKTYGTDIPALEVVDNAEEEGIAREKTEEMLELMKRDGIIFSPTQGVIKFVR